MCPLRCRSAQCLFVAALLPLAMLAGCAADARQLPTASISHGPAAPAQSNPLQAILIGDIALSDDEAEAIIAHATAAHEMARP